MESNTSITEGSLRTALIAGRKLARHEFARVLRMVHRAQQAENESCSAYGPATVAFDFEYGSREAKAIGGMRGYTVLAKRLHVVDGDYNLTVSAWS